MVRDGNGWRERDVGESGVMIRRSEYWVNRKVVDEGAIVIFRKLGRSLRLFKNIGLG